MLPSDEQRLVFRALTVLELIIREDYDEESGIWVLETLSPVMPFSLLLRNGDLMPPPL
jgi:hypothetical protein